MYLKIPERLARATLALEVGDHQFAALLLTDTSHDDTLGVGERTAVAHVAALGVSSAIDDTSYLCPSQGTHTHGAGLDGHVERALWEVLASEGCSGLRDGEHLGVCRGVVEQFDLIMTLC